MDKQELKTPTLKGELKYLLYFYRYMFCKKGKELLEVGLTNFILGLSPILYLIIFEVPEFTKEQNLQFFGDGSLIIFCFGVLVSFVTVNFSIIRENASLEKLRNIKTNNAIFIALCILYYFISYKIFEKAQVNFDRTVNFIVIINLASFLFLIIAFLIVVYLKFSEEYDYSVINPYREKIQAKRKAKEAAKKDNDNNDLDL
jgi:Na+/H+-translocating membrane pyrophosphatase